MSTDTWNAIWPDLVKGAPAAFVAFVIGCIAARIAYNQYLVSKAKLKLDLFDKRLAAFQAIWLALSETALKSVIGPPRNTMTPFNSIKPSAEFLCGTEMGTYIEECVEKWCQLGEAEVFLSAPSETTANQRSDYAKKRQELKAWFHQQASTGAKQRFSEYLDFEEWK